MQQQAVHQRPFKLVQRVAAIAVMGVAVLLALLLAADFADRYQPTRGVCPANGADWQGQVLSRYFENSADAHKDFELLPGAKWNEHARTWEIPLRHVDDEGQRGTYVAVATCDGHAEMTIRSTN